MLLLQLVSERQLDEVLDDVILLNPDTPRVKTDRGVVSPALLLGLDSKLARSLPAAKSKSSAAVACALCDGKDSKSSDSSSAGSCTHEHSAADHKDDEAATGLDALHHAREVDVLELTCPASRLFDRAELTRFLDALPVSSFYRVKGMLNVRASGTAANASAGASDKSPVAQSSPSTAAQTSSDAKAVQSAVAASNSAASTLPAQPSTAAVDLATHTVAQLKEALRARGLPVTGRKPELVERLQAAMAISAAKEAAAGAAASAAASAAAVTATAATATSAAPHEVLLLNWAFGRFDLTPLSAATYRGDTRLTLMGAGICSDENVERVLKGLNVEISSTHAQLTKSPADARSS